MNPWDELADANQQLADAKRHGDVLAVASAEHRVRMITAAIGWRFASALFAATRSEDVRSYVGRLLDDLEIADSYAREAIEELSECIERLSEELLGAQHAMADLRREVETLRRERETVQHEREETGAASEQDPEAIRGNEWRPRVVGW
ncbi:MAG TPA: hypothetical protein VKE74_19465 [Gemmataceae bacterium]|nr:hypothetical protein [Gemmataceae bacterium]